jgi:HAD superfamily phosphatase (TIGR01668 family)
MKRNHKGLFSNYFKPSLYLQSFSDLNMNSLRANGIKLLICDLDNTLAPHYTKLPSNRIKIFLEQLKVIGIKVIVLSNNSQKRVDIFCRKLPIDAYFGGAKKPLKGKTLQILKQYNLKPKEVMIMGDQLVTDILLANRLKIESILIQPIVSVDMSMNKFNIFLEKFIYKRLEKNNILHRGDYDESDKFIEYELL